MARLNSSQFGIQINPVSWTSVAAAVMDTAGGQTEVLVSEVPAATPMVKAGCLRPLAVTTAKRVAAWEGVPALHETLSGFDYAGWIGLVAPTSTPAAVLQRFNRDLDNC